MDIFVEQIIRRRFGVLDYLIFAGCILGGLVLLTATMMIQLLASFMPVVLVAVCVGVYYLITSRNLEFEYIATNGDFTIDKIINRRKRKRIVSMDLHEAEAIGPYKPEEHAGKSYNKKFIVGTFPDGRDAWYIATRVQKFGNVLVVFNPEEKVLAAIKPFLPRQLQASAFPRR